MCQELTPEIKEGFEALQMAELEVDCCQRAMRWLVDKCRYNYQTIPPAMLACPSGCPPLARDMCLRNHGGADALG